MSAHLIRLGLMGAIYFSLCCALITEDLFGAPGLRFFQWIAYLDLAFLSLLGLGFFATVITEEKEEDTLGLMMMAGISPLGILAGKSVGALWQAILLIIVQYPFILLAVTMGGVSRQQVWAVTVALVAYIVFLCGFGVLCSTISSRSKRAASLMTIGLIGYLMVPAFAREYSNSHLQALISKSQTWNLPEFYWTIVGGVGRICLFLRMSEILSTGFGESAFSFQVISNFAIGVFSLGLSWMVFGVATRSPSSEAATRGLVAQKRGFFQFAAGRCWGNPFIWKDFHFVSGGVGMSIVRVLYFGTLGLIPFLAELISGQNDGGWIAFSLGLMIFSTSISAANVLANSMRDEVQAQTLSSLVMLPRSLTGIHYSKVFGALMGWLPGPIIGPVTLLTSDTVREGLRALRPDNWPQLELNSLDEMFFVFVIISLYGMFFVMIPHFATLFALFVRWGSVPLAIGTTMGVYFGFGMLLTALSVIGWFSFEPTIPMTLMAVFMLLICCACHVGVLLRLQSLGAK